MSAPYLSDLPAEITHFYRYQSTKRLDWLKPIILEHRIYVPTAKELNDPRECKPPFLPLDAPDIRRFLLKDWRRRNPGATLEERADAYGEVTWYWSVKTANEVMRQLADILYERTENTRVFSMSRRLNNQAMWAKYADDHRGYCLEFARVGVFQAARPVSYDDSKRLDLRQSAEDVKFAWTHYKSPDWLSEQEIRIALPTFMQAECGIGPEGLTRILLGEKMSDTDRKQIRAWAAKRTPPLVVASVHFDRYTQEMVLA